MAVVIVGGGNAGLQVADSLRRKGFEGDITLFAEEAHLPYQRPPLSKKFLEGALAEARLTLRPEKFYADRAIDVRLDTKVTHIDKDAKTVLTDAGESIAYDQLVFATGARPRPLPGHEQQKGLHFIRTIDDIHALKEDLQGKKSALLIGGGFIGLEAAATLTTLGLKATVVEAMPSIMPGLVAPELAEFFRKAHEAKGVTIIEGASASNVDANPSGGFTAMLSDGRAVSADIVVIGIGVIPNSEIAEAAGLACERGILVDEFGATSDPSVYAAGDCATGVITRYEGRTRLESVQNAVSQAAVVAGSIVGEKAAYADLPWFWSDQYDLKLQMAGLSRGYDQTVVRGDMESRSFSICYFKSGVLIAIDSVNAIKDHMAAKKLLDAGTDITPEQCADTDTPLKDYIA
ncbi:MAG: FAD-dependent oxidoreductase [Kordiimonadaceae bacterium]|nr:FAD-dependent oxidoreductase [Kordiimonadaceae bacterium]MBO6568054.1 FAD-dependent oxidoreductase [Kordiimonadaceae bacterium]MBO6964216.1 FAD-dependent oxidoreductase [Kordiimonadaceae bacterium]